MWTIIKLDNKKINLLKEDFSKKLGSEHVIYQPKFIISKFNKKKMIKKEFNLLGDYLFCFHKNFENSNTLNNLKFTRGLKYFLSGFKNSQREIQTFIDKCKKAENTEGYLSQDFYELSLNSFCKFSSGPFSNRIFQIIKLNKNRIDILMGKFKTSIKSKEFLFKPI